MFWLRLLPVLFVATAVGCEKRSLERDAGSGTIGPGIGGVGGGGTGTGAGTGGPPGRFDAFPDIPVVTEPPIPCGNGRADPGEQCDDGNRSPRDGCNSLCQTEWFESCGGFGFFGPCVVPGCGNYWIDAGETCDDGNGVGGDGCSSACVIEPGWRCPAVGHSCVPICGDGRTVGLETCDDNNTFAGDGCSDFCVLEPTMGRCGDGVREGAEECDPTGTSRDDRGCSSTCRYGLVCGDGVLNMPSEQCDLGVDQNVARYGDATGCTVNCKVPHFCGDGFSDAENGEQCDLGPNNGITGQPCTTTCKICLDCN